MTNISDQPQPLITHLTELRSRLIYCVVIFMIVFCIAYKFSDDIFKFLVQPLSDLLAKKGESRRLIYTNLTEAFTTYLKVSAFTAFFVTFPYLALQIWRFSMPALYKKEKFVFRSFLIATPFLFFSGALFAYYLIFPTAYDFFLSFESPGVNGAMPIQLEAKVNEYLNFVMRLILAFGICFELPVVLSLLAITKFVTSKMLLERWRIAVVVIFAIAAFITPPDIISMIGLAVPLVLLYGLAILMVRFIEKRV